MAFTNTHSPPQGKLVGWLLLLALIGLLLGILFPALPRQGRERGRTEAQVAVSQLAVALRQYHDEYGKWPDFTGDGNFVEPERVGRLMRVLRAQDDANNSHKIVFLEYRDAQPSGSSKERLVSGFDPTTGALLDRWGNCYRIKLDADDDGVTTSPYLLDAETSIRSSVLVWSLGKDGKQADQFRGPGTKISDDIISWQ